MITADFSPVLAELRAMLARTADMQPALNKIGEMQVDAIRARIQSTKHDPDGGAWSPWMPRTEQYRNRKGNAAQGLLWDEGTLLNSIRFESGIPAQGDLFDMPYELAIGTDVTYATWLQDGTKHMASRAFIGWDESQIPLVEEMLARYVEFGMLP